MTSEKNFAWRLPVSWCVAFVSSLWLVGVVGATTVRELLLDEIIDTSAVAFQGVCTSNRTEREITTNMVVTYTTFDVKDVIKGNVSPTHTIKQIGGVMPGGEASYRVHGIPTFTVGEEYVVFMAGVSKSGFSSPIGLSQGKFSVKQGKTGKSITNGTDFRVTASRMANAAIPVTDAPARQLDLDEFKKLARNHASKLQ